MAAVWGREKPPEQAESLALSCPPCSQGVGAACAASRHLLPKDHDLPSDNVSEVVSVAGFKQEAGALWPSMTADTLTGASREQVQAAMGIGEEEYKELEQRCR